jgi:hypothetical protein
MLTWRSRLIAPRMRNSSSVSSGARPRSHHQRAAHREHLLLAAGKRSRLLPAALLQPRKVAVDALEILLHGGLVAARVGAEPEVLLGGESHEGTAPFRHVGDAVPRDGLGRLAADGVAVERDFALGANHAADRA